MNLKLVGQAVVVLILTILNLRCLLYFCAVLKLVISGSVCVHENVCYCVHQQRGLEAIQLLLSKQHSQ